MERDLLHLHVVEYRKKWSFINVWYFENLRKFSHAFGKLKQAAYFMQQKMFNAKPMLFQVNQKIANVKISLYFYKLYTIVIFQAHLINPWMG